MKFCLGLETSVNSVDGFYWKYKENIATVVVAVGGDQICVWFRENFNGIDLSISIRSKLILIFNVSQENGGFCKSFRQNQS
jgi:hypothetical protein